MFLKLAQLNAHHGLGEVHGLGGAREAAEFRREDERLHCIDI